MDVIISLGSNLGNRSENIHRCVRLLEKKISDVSVAHIFESDALLTDDAPNDWDKLFLNTVLVARTSLSPDDLLEFCQQVERQMGRDEKHAYWSPRIIDVDILIYGNVSADTPRLCLPHKEMLNRLFVLMPLQSLEKEKWSPLWNLHFKKAIEYFIQQLIEAGEPVPLDLDRCE